ncbi:hypothetical protein ACLQ2Q_19080 [Microbacterium sp. DT81.1]|uniref:hypothetical protein n=1 Tax=Microbacterium sp. DT81.1 TaxID=3393413 RepID=UPI003CF434E6
MSDVTTTFPRPQGRRLGATLTAAAAAAAAIVLVPASPAAAHHGWDGFDTDDLIYIEGTVSSDGNWGEPHSVFDVTLESDLPADTPELVIPEDLQDPEDSIRVNAALSYDGPQEGLEVIIAPPAWSGRWGLDRALEIGERFRGVGYINRTDDGLFRPVVFWYGDDDVPVNQVLGSTLPVRAPLREAGSSTAPSVGGTAPTPSTTSTAPDPLEVPAADTEAPSGEGGVGSWVVWTVFGIVVAAGVVGGFVYLRRRAQQG